MTGMYRRRAGEPVRVWPVGTDTPVPSWAYETIRTMWNPSDIDWSIRMTIRDYSGKVMVENLWPPQDPEDFARDYEPVPSPDVPAVLGTPEGNAAVVAKLHEMAESVGAVFVPDPDKLARCGGLPPGWLARDVAKAQKRAEELAWPPKPSPDVREALQKACEPWKFHVGEPPEDDSPLSAVFGAGMNYTEELLASLLGVTHYEPGDGSEDFRADAGQTLMNILAAAGLYDEETGQFAALARMGGGDAE